MRLRFVGSFECFFWQCIASQVTIWPATSSSSNSFCTAGISLDFSSISICASTSAVSTANALSTCLALMSLKLSKLPLSALPSNATTRAPGPAAARFRLAACSRNTFSTSTAPQPLQNVPDGGMSGCPFPADLEGLVQFPPMDFDEGTDAAIRIGSAHDRQYRKQQDVRQLIKFAFGAPWIGDCREARK